MLTQARELQAEAWAEEIKTISDGELATHKAIGRATLQMQSRMYLVPKLNAGYQAGDFRKGLHARERRGMKKRILYPRPRSKSRPTPVVRL